jgi:hypothetical protein
VVSPFLISFLYVLRRETKTSAFLKNLLTVIGLLGALIGFVSTVLSAIKQYKTDQAAVTGLLRSHRIWAATGLTVLGIVLLTVVLWRETSHTNFSLIVQVWNVEGDSPHRLVSSRQFDGVEGAEIPVTVLREAGHWLEQQIGKDQTRNPISFRIHIPGNWEKEKVTLEPAGAADLDLMAIAGGGKAHVRLHSLALPAGLSGDVYLEVSRVGYESQQIAIVRGQSQDRQITLQPVGVKVGVEEFQGAPNSVAFWLSNYLAKDPALDILDPNSLRDLRDEIQKNLAVLVRNPGVQTALRTNSGINFMVRGRYEKSSNPGGN